MHLGCALKKVKSVIEGLVVVSFALQVTISLFILKILVLHSLQIKYFDLEKLNTLIEEIASYAWGLPLLILLIGGGLYLILKIQFLPFRYLGHAIAVLRGKYDNESDIGEISHFQALTTALSATIGMGNISGVALAIFIGGPGAVFWMWVSAVIGMSTKFFTATLAIMFRGKDSNGDVQGGPMYFITEGLGKKWKPLAIFFSI